MYIEKLMRSGNKTHQTFRQLSLHLGSSLGAGFNTGSQSVNTIIQVTLLGGDFPSQTPFSGAGLEQDRQNPTACLRLRHVEHRGEILWDAA
jgi:hypothetical protein